VLFRSRRKSLNGVDESKIMSAADWCQLGKQRIYDDVFEYSVAPVSDRRYDRSESCLRSALSLLKKLRNMDVSSGDLIRICGVLEAMASKIEGSAGQRLHRNANDLLYQIAGRDSTSATVTASHTLPNSYVERREVRRSTKAWRSKEQRYQKGEMK